MKRAIRRIKKGIRTIKRIIKRNAKTVILSLGENCLSDNILDRNDLKSFSSPYSSGRSNIEYILSFEDEGFADFLNPNYLKKEKLPDGNTVVRNKKYVTTVNSYNGSVANGFEFTHHDVLSDVVSKETIKRRCNRMLGLKGKKIIFLYHHRMCDETDHSLLISHLNQIANIYESRGNDVSIYLFTQSIITDLNERRVEYNLDHGIHNFVFYTLNEWAGDNEDIFWARCDDDLIKTMIDHIRQSKQV